MDAKLYESELYLYSKQIGSCVHSSILEGGGPLLVAGGKYPRAGVTGRTCKTPFKL